ncbi:MAG: cell division protein FtsZ [Candidatus Staskawiczbacteria bacterium]|nr:cell division protein FtsZ [Candidatus Staskawiczbacteria bacterium]
MVKIKKGSKLKKTKKIKPAKRRQISAKKKSKPKKVKSRVTAKKKTKSPKKNIIKKLRAAEAKKIYSMGTKKKAKKTAKPKKTLKRKIIKKPAIEAPVAEFPAETLFKARIKVVGVGGGGGSIVSEIGRSLTKATFVIADTDIRALKKRPGIKYFWFGDEFTHGLGTGVNIDLARQAAESVKDKIGDIFKDQDIVIFVASLGGGLGSGATQVFAQEAKKFGGITLGIFTLPFKFEGKNKSRIALNALKLLKQALNVSLTIPNEKIFKIIDESTPITNAFSVVNKSLIESLESLIDLIYSPGIINIDFADLRTILKGRGNSAFLNTVEESGKNRAEKICERIMTNPLLQNSAFGAEKILFNIAGSENLSMFEVEKVSSHISQLNPNAKIIFGISKNQKLKSKIKTTILMTGGGEKEEVPIKNIEVIKEKVVVAEKKPVKKVKPIQKKAKVKKQKETKPVIIPAPEIKIPVPALTSIETKKMSITETTSALAKKPLPTGRQAIRRSGLEIKKAEEQEEKKRMAQEKEWEIPAFLRRVKFNK